MTPEIWANRRSSGAASERGNRFRVGARATTPKRRSSGNQRAESPPPGRNRYATMPARNKPAANRDVPAGRRMNGSETFMAADGSAIDSAIRLLAGLPTARRWRIHFPQRSR